MKTLLLPAIFMCIAFSASISYAQQTGTIIEGCEGEGCGCTHETKTNKDFTLYEKMDLKSKVLGKYKTGTDAKAGKSSTKILKTGKSKVVEVKDPSLGLKTGDTVHTVFNLGEGFFKAKQKEKWIEFDDGKVRLKELEAPQYESWLEMTVGKNHGYSPTFPFLGCLE